MLIKGNYYRINTPFRRQDISVHINYYDDLPVIPDQDYDSEDFTTLNSFDRIIIAEDVYKLYDKLKKQYIIGKGTFDYLMHSIFYRVNPNLNCGYLQHYKAIVLKSKKTGRCAISGLENQDVFYIHSHVTPNNNTYDNEYNFVSQAGLERYLEANRDSLSRGNTDIPCFFSGCEKPICTYDTIFITRDEWFINFYKNYFGYGV